MLVPATPCRLPGAVASDSPLSIPAMTTSPTPPPAPRLVRRPAFWAGILFVIAAIGVVVFWPQARIEDYGPLATYRFTSQAGQPFGTHDLKGRVYVANFVFTRCPTICPRFTSLMAGVQQQLGDGTPEVHLVSISVDPDFDTPEVLTEYAARYHADPARWTFLTGNYKEIEETVVKGFKIAMGRESPDEDDVMSIFHGEHFVVVDQRGHLRGYVHANEPDAVDQVVALARALADEG